MSSYCRRCSWSRSSSVAETCTTTGLTAGSHCSRCEEILVEQEEIAALGHAYAQACLEVATCTRCGFTTGEPLAHDIVIDEAVAATCTTSGLCAKTICLRVKKHIASWVFGCQIGKTPFTCVP